MHIRAWTDRDFVEISPGPHPHGSSDENYIKIPVSGIPEFIARLRDAKEFVDGKSSYCSFEVTGVE